MANGVDTAMEEVERTAPQPRLDPSPGDFQLGELETRHDPMLPPGYLRDRRIETGAAFALI
jgi:hypothetical protein